MPHSPRTRQSCILATTLLVALWCGPGTCRGCQNEQEPATQSDKTIEFSAFYRVEWREIIEFYAKEAGLSLQLPDQPPSGTFDYQSNRVYSLKDGLDFLNQMLTQRDRVLIQNEDMLTLYDVTKGIPDDVIQTVPANELDQRGKYEILNATFDITGLTGEDLRSQLGQVVSSHYQSKLAFIPAANVLIVQEVGHRLRFIRDNVIEPARKSRGRNDWDVKMIKLAHISPEEVLVHVSGALGIDRTTLSNAEKTIALSIAPFGNQMVATGNPDMINQLQRIIEAIDQPTEDENAADRTPPYFLRYPVVGDAEKMYRVLAHQLASSPVVKIDFDPDANLIYLLGRDEDHALANEIINKMQGSSDEFAVITIKEGNVKDVITTIEKLFRKGTSTDEPYTGPVLTSESQNRLVVRGKPAEVAMVRKMIDEIDVELELDGPRTTNRFVTLSGSEMNRTMTMLEGMLPTLNLENRIEVVRPEERSLFFNSESRSFEVLGGNRTQEEPEPGSEENNQPPGEEAGDGENKNDGGILNKNTNGNRRREVGRNRNRTIKSLAFSGLALMVPGSAAMAFMVQEEKPAQEPTGNGSASSSREQGNADLQTDDEVPSVPGAPITIRITEYGISLHSEDLDALDQIQKLILDHVDTTSGLASTRVYLLSYIDANEAKKLLDQYLGNSGGGGGDANPLGNLMGNMLGNAMGGGAGDMVSGLLGGGASSSSSTGVFETEDVVSIVANPKNQSLAISATPSDMDLVLDLIEFIDRPGATHRPNPLGNTRLIPVRYQSLEVVEELIKKNLSAIVNTGESGGQAQQQNAEAQMLQALLGRNRGGGGGGGGDTEIEAPKATIAIDQRNKAIVVTGPDHLYEIIREFVESIDSPRPGPPNTVEVIANPGIVSPKILEILALQDPDNIEIIPFEPPTDSATGERPQQQQASAQPGGAVPQSPFGQMNQQQRQEFMRAVQGLQQGRGGQGGDAGGGGNRGGGGGNRGGGGGNPGVGGGGNQGGGNQGGGNQGGGNRGGGQPRGG
jgi:type II secretory pathway component GspD/PulD (secretin)